ncbi:MAG: RNA-binding S4 domain-containing protein [Candidatus Peribacteraceae bacterium]
MDEFNLDGNEYVELKNLLKLMGMCDSGGEAMAAIAEGQVRVDGNVEMRKRCKIRTGQTVEFEGRSIVVK